MKKLGIGITGSFCNLINALDIYEELAKEYEITFFYQSNNTLLSSL